MTWLLGFEKGDKESGNVATLYLGNTKVDKISQKDPNQSVTTVQLFLVVS